MDMPNLKNLVAEGTTFTDAHSTPICAPSRYMLLSGNYQHRGVRHTGIWNANYKTSNFWEGQQSIAEVLRNNGYNCGVFGKWHLGGESQLRRGAVISIRNRYSHALFCIILLLPQQRCQQRMDLSFQSEIGQ